MSLSKVKIFIKVNSIPVIEAVQKVDRQTSRIVPVKNLLFGLNDLEEQMGHLSADIVDLPLNKLYRYHFLKKVVSILYKMQYQRHSDKKYIRYFRCTKKYKILIL